MIGLGIGLIAAALLSIIFAWLADLYIGWVIGLLLAGAYLVAATMVLS